MLGLLGRASPVSPAPGNPSLEKCRVLKEQREEAAEVASLDVTNIIHCSGASLRLLPPLERRGMESQTAHLLLPRPSNSRPAAQAHRMEPF